MKLRIGANAQVKETQAPVNFNKYLSRTYDVLGTFKVLETAVNTRSKDLPSWCLCFGGLSGKGKAALIFANLLTWTLGWLKGYPLLTPPPASPASSLCSPEVLVSNSWHGYSISPQCLHPPGLLWHHQNYIHPRSNLNLLLEAALN